MSPTHRYREEVRRRQGATLRRPGIRLRAPALPPRAGGRCAMGGMDAAPAPWRVMRERADRAASQVSPAIIRCASEQYVSSV